MSEVPTIHDVEWSWSGWDEGEELDPPEPGKRWLTINHWGDEFAVIVHRMTYDGVRDAEVMWEKEQRAINIVASLSRNLDEARKEAIINIRMAIQHLAPLEGPSFETPEISSAMSDLEQAVRFLTREEQPS